MPKTFLFSPRVRPMRGCAGKLARKNPVIWYAYNEYVEHHYVYMTKVAEIRELDSYVGGGTWSQLENDHRGRDASPRGVKPIKCRWAYKVKYNTEGSIKRYEARLVAKGYVETTWHRLQWDFHTSRKDNDRSCVAGHNNGIEKMTPALVGREEHAPLSWPWEKSVHGVAS